MAVSQDIVRSKETPSCYRTSKAIIMKFLVLQCHLYFHLRTVPRHKLVETHDSSRHCVSFGVAVHDRHLPALF